MNPKDTIKRTIVDDATLFGFEYAGKRGNIDPGYDGIDAYLLFYDGREQVVTDLDSVFTTPFVSGRTLLDVFDEIIVTDD